MTSGTAGEPRPASTGINRQQFHRATFGEGILHSHRSLTHRGSVASFARTAQLSPGEVTPLVMRVETAAAAVGRDPATLHIVCRGTLRPYDAPQRLRRARGEFLADLKSPRGHGGASPAGCSRRSVSSVWAPGAHEPAAAQSHCQLLFTIKETGANGVKSWL
jgi:hypothetical protein